jgi:hypothetical protein
MNQYKLLVILGLYGCLFFSACKSKEVIVPSYLFAKPYTFTTNEDRSEGAATADVKDYWIFENEKILGSFGIPSDIPIQKSGKTPIRISAGIRRSGQEEERMIYPLYNSYITNVDLRVNQTDTIIPNFTYLDNCVFKFIEDFDKNGVQFEYNPSFKLAGDTIIREKGNKTWDKDSYSGKVVLKQDGSILEIYSEVFKSLPKFTPMFFEIDYKNNVPFTIGIYVTEIDGSVEQVPLIVLKEKDSWNKLYFDLESEISSRAAGTEFRIFLRFSNILSAPISNPEVYIDNLKLIHLD